MYRILIGSVFHETNTFWPFPTGLEEFKKRNYLLDDALIDQFQNTHTVLGAYIEVLRENSVEIIPSIAAIAEPSGAVTAEAIREIKRIIFTKCKEAGKLDAILLSLHGAMVTEDHEDGDGNFLEELRAVVGWEIPIIATLDLHTNLTQKMVDNATALIPYREYPHSDMYDRGLDAVHLMMRTLRGEVKPVMRWKQLPLLTALIETEKEACRPIMEASAAAREREGILNASVLHGFYAADTVESGASALVVSDASAELAQQTADSLAGVTWENREGLVRMDTYTPQEAIAKAGALEGPVVFADVCDNPGAGSSEDGTHLLRALLEAGVEKVAYAVICDPETVVACHEAGVGKSIDIRLGGKKNPDILGEPIACKAYIKSLSDGVYLNRGPMHGGLGVNLKKSAVVVVGGVTVIVTSIPTQTYDIEIFQSHGLMLKDFHILVVKSSIHYRAAFGPHCKKMFSVECPGALVVDPRNLTYKNCRRPVYPLDEL